MTNEHYCERCTEKEWEIKELKAKNTYLSELLKKHQIKIS